MHVALTHVKGLGCSAGSKNSHIGSTERDVHRKEGCPRRCSRITISVRGSITEWLLAAFRGGLSQ